MLEIFFKDKKIGEVEEGGSFKLSNGDVVSPAYVGWKDKIGHKLVEKKVEINNEVECSKVQLKIEFYRRGLLAQASSIIEQDPTKLMVWGLTTSFKRSDKHVEAIRRKLKWMNGIQVTVKDMDDIFESASKIDIFQDGFE